MRHYTLVDQTEMQKKSLSAAKTGSKTQGLIKTVSEAEAGDVVDNVPVKWLGESPAVIFQVLVFLSVVFSQVIEQNILAYFITDPDVLATLTRWITGIVALVTVVLIAKQNFVVTPKVSQE